MAKTSQLQRLLAGRPEHIEAVETHDIQLRLDPANTDPQTGVVVLVDDSGSTGFNGAIHKENEGLALLRDELLKDPVAVRRVQIAGLSYGGKLKPFTPGFVPPSEFNPPILKPGGLTPMAESLLTVCQHVKAFKNLCHEAMVDCGPIEVISLGDGSPTDSKKMLASARQAMLELEECRWAKFHVFIVDGCDTSIVNGLFPRPAMRLAVEEILPMFRSFSSSLRQVSRGTVGRDFDLQTAIRLDMEGE